MRILKGGSATTLKITFYDDETAVSAGAVTVTVKNTAGTTVSTGSASAGAGTGDYTYSLPSQSALGPLTVTWAGSQTRTTNVEVVGGFIFQLPELRSFDDSLASNTKYTTAELKDVRERVEVEFESITGRSFTQRRAAVDVVGQAGRAILPRADVTAATDVAGASLGILYPWGEVWGVPNLTTTVVYDYGFAVVPEDIKWAAMVRARSLLHSTVSGIPDRATSFQAVEGGSYTLATAGRAGYSTGIPDVDAILDRYSLKKGGAVG